MEWIKVSDRLPVLDKNVIVLVTDGKEFNEVSIGVYDGLGWYTHQTTWEDNDKVTHWMPLPQKPKDE